MLENFSPFKFGAILAAILIGIFSVRFFIMSIQYYRIYHVFKQMDIEKQVEQKQPNFFFSEIRLSAGDDYNYPYSDELNYNFDNIATPFSPVIYTHLDEQLYILVKLYIYLTTIYWVLGFAFQPFLLYGIFGGSDICLLIWLYAIALKIAATVKLLTCLFLYVGGLKNRVIFMWPHGDFPFVLFLIFLWFLVFFYFLESQSSFFMSRAQTTTTSTDESSSSNTSLVIEPTPTELKNVGSNELRNVKIGGDLKKPH